MAKFCNECGTQIQAKWKICAECGAPVLSKRQITFNEKRKIKRIKISVIITMIIGTVIVVSQAASNLSLSDYNYSRQKLSMLYDDGLITYDEYDDRRDQLYLDLYSDLWVISNISFYAKIGLNVAFIFVIIGFLSISVDRNFNNKTRRISLIIACIFLIFGLYSIFIPSPTLQLYPYLFV